MDTNTSKCILLFKKIFTSFTPLLSRVSCTIPTIFLMLLMIVCIVLIWFLLNLLQESGNLDAIFKVRRQKKKDKIIKLVLLLTSPPPRQRPYFFKVQKTTFFVKYIFTLA